MVKSWRSILVSRYTIDWMRYGLHTVHKIRVWCRSNLVNEGDAWGHLTPAPYMFGYDEFWFKDKEYETLFVLKFGNVVERRNP